MAIIQTMTEGRWLDAWGASGLATQFSRPALIWLYEWLLDISEAGGGDIEFDPVKVCTEWIEYESVAAAIADGYTDDSCWICPEGPEGLVLISRS
jgi:hypothetical protein